jgi:hypothetical protein
MLLVGPPMPDRSRVMTNEEEEEEEEEVYVCTLVILPIFKISV